MTIDSLRQSLNTPQWFSMANESHPRRDDPPDHLEPSGQMRRVDDRLDKVGFMLDELGTAKARAAFWKRMYVRELKRRADYPTLKRDGAPYGVMELDHAQDEAAYWNDTTDKAGNVFMEYQS